MNTSFQSGNQILSSALQTQLESDLNVSNPKNEWLNKIRLENYLAFSKQPLPNRKIEHWKYNDLYFLTKSKFQATTVTTERPTNFSNSIPGLEDAIICVFIDGKYSSEHSSKMMPLGVSITSFGRADAKQADIISDNLKAAKQQKNMLLQLNTALSQDGVLIEIESNQKIEHPLYLLHFASAGDDNKISTNLTVVSCGRNSQCQLVEHFISEQSNSTQMVLQQSIIHLQQNSQCHHYRLNLEAATSLQVSRALLLLEKDSRLNSFYYSEGSQLNKTDIDIRHQGKNSESLLTGIFLPSNSQTIDYHTNIEHRISHCTSREVFRGIIADSAKATFNGKIHIYKDAQKSDAQLSNKNLLLTNQAEINTKPELEIYADDVVCAHGATVAKIDHKAVYYLQTRGIEKSRAKKMLSVGFINELLDRVENAPLSHYLKEQVQTCLSDIK